MFASRNALSPIGSYSSPKNLMGAQWLSGRVLDSRPRGRGFEPLASLRCGP